MRKSVWLIVVSMLAGIFMLPNQASACRQSYRGGFDRVDLARLPLAFVGTVSALADDERQVTFRVERLISGEAPGGTVTLPLLRLSCEVRFGIGERWLFGGTSVLHPTMLLADQDGNAVNEPPKWLATR